MSTIQLHDRNVVGYPATLVVSDSIREWFAPKKYSSGYYFGVKCQSGHRYWSAPYPTVELCAAEFNKIFTESNKGGNMFKELTGGLKKYVNEHQETIYTIAIALLIDRFVFGGAFQERIKAIVEGFLNKAESKVKGA